MISQTKIFYLSFFAIALVVHCQEIKENVNDNKNLSISENYVALRDDVQWFFQRLEILASTMERMLPNTSITNAEQEKRTFTENMRIHLLMWLRHLLIGIKEISMTFQECFDTNHARELQQLKLASTYIHDIIIVLKNWFANIRALASEIFRTYNYYMPEVLLGKCFGHYIVSVYPDRAFYEYPILLLSDVFKSIYELVSQEELEKQTYDSINTTSDITGPTAEATHKLQKPEDYNPRDLIPNDISVEQNEIPYKEINNYRNSRKSPVDSVSSHEADATTSNNAESFFNFSDIFDSDKELIENATITESWQKCLKLYTADNVARQLRIFFLDI